MSAPANKNNWRTPAKLIPLVEGRLGAFDMDLCATPGHQVTALYFAPPSAGLERNPTTGALEVRELPEGCVGLDGLTAEPPHAGMRIWCNPPYGRGQIEGWVARCRRLAWEGHDVVALLPMDSSTAWWQAHVMKAATLILPNRRLRFQGGPSGATRASVLVVWEPGLAQPWGMNKPRLEAMAVTLEQAGRPRP